MAINDTNYFNEYINIYLFNIIKLHNNISYQSVCINVYK